MASSPIGLARVGRRLAGFAVALALAGLAGCAPHAPETRGPAIDAADTALLDDLEHRTFEFFWHNANPRNGLVADRAPTPAFSSIAAVGFALTAYPVGVERGYVTRSEARQRVLTTLRFFRDAPAGDQNAGVTGYKGFYYHFLDMQTGLRFQDTELSTIDTALLLGGVLFCSAYFDGADPEELEVRQLADTLLGRAEWTWPRPPRR
jgi:hypothetical protein